MPSLPAPPSTASELVLQRADDDRPGLRFEGRAWSWRQVLAEGSARAALLEELRRPGEPFHVGVLSENIPEYLFLLVGAALAGAVLVGVNPTRRGAELAADIAHTDCGLLVVDPALADLVADLDLGATTVLVVDSPQHLEQLARHAGAPPPDRRPGPEDLYLLIFTSGSTGTPKAVRFSQGRAARAAQRVPFGPDDVLYCAMPLFHGNSLNSSIFPAFASGATIALRRRFSASQFLPDVRDTGATFTSTVGRAIAHLLATPPTAHDRDHSLKFVLGPETSEPDKAAFVERFGVPLFEGYGSSENAIVLLPAPRARPGALGTAQEGDDIAVVDPATGDECPRARFDPDGRLLNPGEAIGELVGRDRAASFEGYYRNPDAEAERTRNGWYWSGDLAYRDDAGVFYFAGRSGEWLRVDSENFAAAPIDRILARYPPATGAAVYAVPDVRTGDQVMAALELRAGSEFDPAGFAVWLADQPDLGTKWAPRYVRIVRALPVTGTDKIDKRPLRRERWDTTDPIWHRRGRSAAYVPFTDEDRSALLAELEANGRANLLI
jgi:fatty-acyl-CoA synthase